MIWSLRNRVLAAVLVVAVFTAVASVVLTWTYVTNARSAAERIRTANAQAVQQVAYRYLLPVGSGSKEWAGINRAAKAAALSVKARVVVLDRASGDVLADSDPARTPVTGSDADAILNPAFSMVAMVENDGVVRSEGTFSCGEGCFKAVPGSSPPVDLVVLLDANESGVGAKTNGPGFDALGTALAIAAVVTVAGLLAAFVSNRVTRPVAALSASVTKVGRGELGERFDRGNSVGEIADLGRTFNEMAANLQHSESARTAMIADIAHELRNPIGTILGNIEAVQDHVLPLDPALLGRLHSEAVHLADLTDDVQQLALADAGQLSIEPELLDLGHLVGETVSAYRPLAERQGIVLTTTAAWPLMVAADPTRIRQVIGNLVKNAITHTPAGGTVKVDVSALTDGFRIEVIDNGIGLSIADQGQVFDRFWRADPSRSRKTGGTGVGLAISETLVKSHGGSITVSSEPGSGSHFTVTLPRPPST